jgi:hypothetical protein
LVLDASSESLLIYWLHLVTLYGTFGGRKSFAMIIRPTLNIIESITTNLFLKLVMIITSKIWGWIKMISPKYAGKVAWAVAAFFV